MTVRVGINGFGRIGRNFYRAARAQGGDVEVVAVNDLTSPEVNAHLLAYDSTQGRLGVPVEVVPAGLRVGDHLIKVLAERDPKALPWGDLGVDVVVESTGIFTDGPRARGHLDAGALKVVISAPATNVDGTFVVGVNDDTYDAATQHVVSNASCTTNCFVPMVKVLDDAFGVVRGLMTTVHAYTNDQNLLDLTHKDLRRARAAAVNVIPSSTGAARATGLVLQAMQGRLDGISLRVPVPVGSITDLVAVLDAEVTTAEVNEAFYKASSSGELGKVLDYSEAPLVSSDIVGSPASCTFDSKLTMALSIGSAGSAGSAGSGAGRGSALVKVFGWYDNEWGYSNRLVDLVRIVGAGPAAPGAGGAGS
ncbi:MAG: type I glyceraldehyde-3-phosphate dehydrogenase [Acidimicrobiales bacterium]